MRYELNQAVLTKGVKEDGVTDTPPWEAASSEDARSAGKISLCISA